MHPPTAIRHYTYADIQKAIAENSLQTLDWDSTKSGQFPQIYVEMPSGLDVVVQTARPIGAHAFVTFPACRWTLGDTDEVAGQIQAIVTEIGNSIGGFTDTIANYRATNIDPLPRKPSREDLLLFKGRKANGESLYYSYLSSATRAHANHIDQCADALHGFTCLVSDPTMLDDLSDAIHTYTTRAGEVAHSLSRLSAASEELSDAYSDAANHPGRESDNALAEYESRFSSVLQQANVKKHAYEECDATLHAMLAAIMIQQGESLDNFSNKLMSLQTQANRAQKITGKKIPEVPAYPQQLGIVLAEAISQMNISHPGHPSSNVNGATHIDTVFARVEGWLDKKFGR